MGVGILGGTSGTTADVDTNSRGLRTTLRPNDIGALGSYSKMMTSGTIGAGLTAASLVYAFRWAPSTNTNLAIIRRIRISLGDVTGFTAGFIALNGFVARSYTVIEATGGTAGTFTGNNAKLKTAHATTQGAACYISTTAAISGGTETLDTDPFCGNSTSVIATAGNPLAPAAFDLFRPQAHEWPLVLANQEGFVIKATVPATGTWQLGVEVAWDEMASFQ